MQSESENVLARASTQASRGLEIEATGRPLVRSILARQANCGELIVEAEGDGEFDFNLVHVTGCGPSSVERTPDEFGAVINYTATVVNDNAVPVATEVSWEVLVSGVLSPIVAQSGVLRLDPGEEATASDARALTNPVSDVSDVIENTIRAGGRFGIQARPVNVREV